MLFCCAIEWKKIMLGIMWQWNEINMVSLLWTLIIKFPFRPILCFPKFDMFMLQNDYVDVCLQIPISMVVPNVVVNDGVDRIEEYDSSFNNDG